MGGRADTAPAAGLVLTGGALGWLAGVGAQLQQAALSPLAAYGGAAAIGLVLLVVAAWPRRATSRGAWRLALVLLAATSAGAGITGLQASARLTEALQPALEGADIELRGVVAAMPQAGPDGVRFRFDVEQATQAGHEVTVPATLSLGWYRAWDGEAASSSGPMDTLRAGQRWQLPVHLRQPHGNVNPYGYDFELWLFEQGIRATGSVRSTAAQSPRLLDEAVAHPVERWRQSVRDAIERHVREPHAAGVLAALAVGDQAAIERADWDLFRNTGVAHLMSISGLHVTMFAWLAGVLIGWLWRLQERWMLACPAPVAARWGGLAAALAYSVFAGWGVPAQRTVGMLAVATLLQGAGMRWPWPLILLAAAVGVTAYDPWAMLQPGFWLSFVAVGLLMASAPGEAPRPPDPSPQPRVRRWLARLRDMAHGGLRTQIIATLALTPLTLLFFQQVSVVGFLANLVAIPVVTLLVTPLALLGVVLPPLWGLAAVVVHALDGFLRGLAGWPGAVWAVGVAPLWAQAAGLLAGVLAVLPLPWRLRLLGVPLALPLLWPVPERPAPGQFELIAADVGQGTAVLVRTQAHLLVFDAGPRYGRDSDAGGRVLLPLLRALGETRFDRLVLSHRDTDHVGGAAALMQALPPRLLSSSLEATHALLRLAPQHERCMAGQSWTWDGVRFDVLQPREADYERGLKPNAMSCVVRVHGASQSALLTGDIEREQELAMVAAYGDALRSDLLLAPHHGSKTSSSSALLDAVQPRVAVIQAGYRNRFGHPAPEVLGRYRERAIMTLATPACGAYVWRPGLAACERERSRRYWQSKVSADTAPPEPAGEDPAQQ